MSSDFLDFLDPDENRFSNSYQPDPESICSYSTVSEFNKMLKNNNSGLTILNYNIRSFKKNFDSFISIFESYNETPDILILTETWFSETIPNLF